MIKNLQYGNKIEGWNKEVTTVLELPDLSKGAGV
jgi:hypothetical protein